MSYLTAFKKQIYKQLQTLTTDDYESLNFTISLILPTQINQPRNDSNGRRSLYVFDFVCVRVETFNKSQCRTL